MNHKYKPHNSTALVFEKNGFVIAVDFSDRNTVQKIEYSKGGFGRWEKISKEECKALLDVNSNGEKWLLVDDSILKQLWITEDRSLHGFHYSKYNNRKVAIETDYYLEKAKSEKKEDARRVAEGL